MSYTNTIFQTESYSTRCEWLEPRLARLERHHQWRENPAFITEVFGPFWGLGYTETDMSFVSFNRRGRKISVYGKKCFFFPPFSIFEVEIAGGNKKMHWVGVFSLEKPPIDLPREVMAFDLPSNYELPQSLNEAFALIRKAQNPIILSKEETPSAVAFQVKNYLDNHFSQEVSISEVAKKLGFNQAVMDRAFKQCFGITPISYRIRIKILSAAFFMMLKGCSGPEAAKQLGISNLDRFTRYFRKFIHSRPKEFRSQDI